MAFEQLGPTFVKLGQLLATRPDLIPAEYVEEFTKLHDQVKPVDFAEIKGVIENQFGEISSVFEWLDEKPIASASIAQVHHARLIGGIDVVVKVRRPGIVEIINNDLNVLYTIAGLLEKYVPETKVFGPTTIVDEFFKTLELETNFVVEANNMKRFSANFKDQTDIKIPKVYEDFSGEQVLVMETIKGVPLARLESGKHPEFNKELIVRNGLKAFFKMVFRDRFFHGDLHAGNFFILPDNQIGLVDFGVVGRLSQNVTSAIADMLVALAQEDYESLAYAYVELAPYAESVDVDVYARDLRDLIAPYYGLSFRNVNAGRLLMDSAKLAAKHGLQVPSELMLFFKAIVTVEGMGRTIIEDFDVLQFALEFATEIVSAKYDPQKISKDLFVLAKDSTSLLYSLPRQIKQLLRKVNNSEHAWKIKIDQIEDLRRAVETGSNLIFLGLIVAGLIMSAAISINFKDGAEILGLPIFSLTCVVLAIFTGSLAVYNYMKK